MSCDIVLSDRKIGSIAPTPNHPIASRNRANVNVLGVSLTIHLLPQSENTILLSQFEGEVLMYMGDGAEESAFIFPLRIDRQAIISRNHETNPNLAVSWYISKTEFADIEASRQGRSIQIRLKLQFLVQEMTEERSNPNRILSLRSIDQPIPRNAQISISPSKEEWIKILKRLNIVNLVLFEFPIRIDSADLAGIRNSIDIAIDHFNNGDSVLFKDAIANIRIAIEAAEKAYSLPPKSDNWWKAGTPRIERLLLLWKALRNLCHLAAHEHDEWSRNEAQLILINFISLYNLIVPNFRQANLP